MADNKTIAVADLAALEVKPAGKIVADPNVCSGCKTCMYVCSLSHEGVANPNLGRIHVDVDYQGGYLVEFTTCKQCTVAECMLACRKGAISIDPATGAKVVDPEKCVGCKACVKACPASDPKPIKVVNKKAIKCDLCGGDPQCVRFCAMGALKYKEAK